MSDTHLALIIILVSLSLNRGFEQKTGQFFLFNEESNSWVPVELPYEFVTCVNGNCTTVGSIREAATETRERRFGEDHGNEEKEKLKKGDGNQDGRKLKDSYQRLLPLRKLVSLMKMSETSIWVTGESGSIYERFWNGVQWVIAPHDLPSSAGPAISVFLVNQTNLALSEAGYLYQLQLTENSQLVWTEFAAVLDQIASEDGQQQAMVKSGMVANDGETICFCTKNGSLIELVQVEPPRWVNHGQPPGADVAAIADVATIRPNLVFTISSAGDLYEHDKSTKPPWKKHIWREGSSEDTSLIASRGCITQGLGGASSVSLFLVTKAGKLVERRLNQRKWKWIVHGSSESQLLTSITPVLQDESSEKYSVFLTTASGLVLEYQTAKQAVAQEHQTQNSWVNHQHPFHAKVARGIPGISYLVGRTFFALDDGRLAELHISGIGGENSGPFDHQVSHRRKTPLKYTWSILDTPETEGWNAEYCTDERGPSNCMMGVKDDYVNTRTMTRRRKKGVHQTYLIPDAISSIDVGISSSEQLLDEKLMNNYFHMRVMQGGRSFFLVTDSGLTFEYLYNDNVGLWLRHEHPTVMNGAVGSYNGSLFLVDIHGSLLIRERNNVNELKWINCTAMKKGRQIIGGPPWDRVHGSGMKITAEDALYFVSKKGRLLQFTVALRKFKWKDCRNPANTMIATIVDQQVLRDKVVFVTGINGRLYQYNTLSGLWHEHYQSPHLILSRTPGTAMRPSSLSSKGSLFMMSADGGLVEYQWSSVDGWMWVEHGTPTGGVSFVGATGPSYDGYQLFLIGSDGKVYIRYLDQVEWKWRDCGFPDSDNISIEDQKESISRNAASLEDTQDHEVGKSNRNCDSKVASTRPIPSAEDTVIFELRDGRLAEMHRVKDTDWIWSRIIATPTSLCISNFWAAAAS